MSICVGEQKVMLMTALGTIFKSLLLHVWRITNPNSDATHIRAISEAAIQFRFYNHSDDKIEIINSFVLLVATKNKYRDVLGNPQR